MTWENDEEILTAANNICNSGSCSHDLYLGFTEHLIPDCPSLIKEKWSGDQGNMTPLIGSEGSEASFAKICHLGNNDYRSHSSNQITFYA